ncbi:L-threonine O-3-phosphate decarboxylase [Hoeflea marina]|uniref:threonine-phosphate decarboxylase n=1 Tax=Hoeflea marina TaxID=274592 RepID=A0A317PG12_9HYPH|nr:threonine-phosphate decarboxylase CobD [Hoeflea marina]PWV98964.1 L-threonine O-3-phosphate decarboxylase [Hoeflea marina]
MATDPKPIAHGGALADAMARHGGAAADWLDLSTGVSPFSLELPAMDTDVWRRLPDPATVREMAAAARAYYRGGQLPVPTPGSQAAIQLLPRLAPSGLTRRVAILSPTYGEYELAFRRAGFDIAAATMLDAALDADVAVLANPNNPDGRRFDRATLTAFAEARAGRLTVVDEAFADMHPDLSIADLAGHLPGLVVLRSFGKFFGMAGIRLGFAFADREISAALEAGLGPWAVSGPALAVAGQAFSRPDLVDGLKARISTAHALTLAAIAQAGLELAGETALFALVGYRGAARLRDRLAADHVLTRAFDHSPDRLRIGLVADPEQAARLSATLRKAAAEGPA